MSQRLSGLQRNNAEIFQNYIYAYVCDIMSWLTICSHLYRRDGNHAKCRKILFFCLFPFVI